MTSTNQIILSQLTPPASRSSVLFRERVNRLLEGSLEHRLTLLVAETGFGKTTSLLAFLERAEVPQVFWFSVRGAERDPRLFLSYLFSAFSQRGLNLGQEALRLLANTETDETDALVALVNTLSQHLPGPSLLVLDDFQSVRESRSVVALVDWFVDHRTDLLTTGAKWITHLGDPVVVAIEDLDPMSNGQGVFQAGEADGHRRQVEAR